MGDIDIEPKRQVIVDGIASLPQTYRSKELSNLAQVRAEFAPFVHDRNYHSRIARWVSVHHGSLGVQVIGNYRKGEGVLWEKV